MDVIQNWLLLTVHNTAQTKVLEWPFNRDQRTKHTCWIGALTVIGLQIIVTGSNVEPLLFKIQFGGYYDLLQVSAKGKLKTKEIITPKNIRHCFHQCPLARMFRYKVSVLIQTRFCEGCLLISVFWPEVQMLASSAQMFLLGEKCALWVPIFRPTSNENGTFLPLKVCEASFSTSLKYLIAFRSNQVSLLLNFLHF